MIRVHRNGTQLERLTLDEHTIVFNAAGFADGSALTHQELDRLRKFHFRVEMMPEVVAPRPVIVETRSEQIVDDDEEVLKSESREQDAELDETTESEEMREAEPEKSKGNRGKRPRN